ncbi:MAG: cytochrome B [Hyphomicrobiaceae bacterium]|nr:cytochrome B [Hyphomicrobiaceae bacterium]
MVLAWCLLFPIGVLIARFFKIMPKQNWPEQLDNKTWWRGHLVLQYAGGAALLAGVVLIIATPSEGAARGLHALIGWSITSIAITQFLGGWLRGSKGGPTAPASDGSFDGDHYSMTPRRRIFERIHKSVGYIGLIGAVGAVLSGLWLSNAPRWMWLTLIMWWTALIAAALFFQRRGRAIDTYQAIWGPDSNLPGNKIPPIGWGIRRPRASTQLKSKQPDQPK